MSAPIRSIAVVGSGIAAAVAAATFARRLPNIQVTIVPVADPKPALVDLVATTTPTSAFFHTALGLEEGDIVRRTRGAWRLGSRTIAAGYDYVHAYGPVGAPIESVSFAAAFEHLSASSQLASMPFETWSTGARLGRAALLPGSIPGLAEAGVGMALDPAEYRGYMIAFARHVGAKLAPAALADVHVEEGSLAGLQLQDGSVVQADLYCDASGADRCLTAAIAPPDHWVDWANWLPCDHIIRACSPPFVKLPTLDTATRSAEGWYIRIALPDRTDHLFACPATTPDNDAAHALSSHGGGAPLDRVVIPNGRARAAWINNVVAIGDAAAAVGVLDAAPIQLLHAQIEMILNTLPDRNFAAIEIAHHNRLAMEQAERLRDFQVAHDPTAARPPELADTVARFAARGRWRDRDGELQERSDWQMLLHGTGIRPRLSDATASAADLALLERAMLDAAARLDVLVAAAPTHREVLKS